MKYIFPVVMLIGGIGLMAYGQALVGILLAFFACVTYSDVLESDKGSEE